MCCFAPGELVGNVGVARDGLRVYVDVRLPGAGGTLEFAFAWAEVVDLIDMRQRFLARRVVERGGCSVQGEGLVLEEQPGLPEAVAAKRRAILAAAVRSETIEPPACVAHSARRSLRARAAPAAAARSRPPTCHSHDASRPTPAGLARPRSAWFTVDEASEPAEGSRPAGTRNRLASARLQAWPFSTRLHLRYLACHRMEGGLAWTRSGGAGSGWA